MCRWFYQAPLMNPVSGAQEALNMSSKRPRGPRRSQTTEREQYEDPDSQKKQPRGPRRATASPQGSSKQDGDNEQAKREEVEEEGRTSSLQLCLTAAAPVYLRAPSLPLPPFILAPSPSTFYPRPSSFPSFPASLLFVPLAPPHALLLLCLFPFVLMPPAFCVVS